MADLKVLKKLFLPGYLFWLLIFRSCPLCLMYRGRSAPAEELGDPVLHLASEHLEDIERAVKEYESLFEVSG